MHEYDCVAIGGPLHGKRIEPKGDVYKVRFVPAVHYKPDFHEAMDQNTPERRLGAVPREYIYKRRPFGFDGQDFNIWVHEAVSPKRVCEYLFDCAITGHAEVDPRQYE